MQNHCLELDETLYGRPKFHSDGTLIDKYMSQYKERHNDLDAIAVITDWAK